MLNVMPYTTSNKALPPGPRYLSAPYTDFYWTRPPSVDSAYRVNARWLSLDAFWYAGRSRALKLEGELA